jgi:hypothetical protein
MNKLIHRYLTENYRILGNRVYTDKVYMLSSSTFVSELEKIFGLTKKQLKWYVKSWVRKQNRNFDFDLWWSPSFNFITLPLVSRSFGQTITQDLVTVQPMHGPQGRLMYIDYQIGIDPAVVDEFNPRQGILSRYFRTEVNRNYYGTMNVDFTPIDNSVVVNEMLNNWRNLINEQLEYEQ